MIKFIDLFAGIGGFHLGLLPPHYKCVAAAENDKPARKTYLANFKLKDEMFFNDVNGIDLMKLPEFDLLCAGFPCQPFSNIGKGLGFSDTRGTMFYEIEKILKHSKPKILLLENVPGLLSHNGGDTFSTIITALTSLEYSVSYKTLLASDYGIPQNRSRVFIVGFKNNTNLFEFPAPIPLEKTLSDVLGGQCNKEIAYTLRVGGKNSPYGNRHNWDGYCVGGINRRLTVAEGAELQGFPKNFVFPVSKTQAFKQLGNAVNVKVVEALGKQIINHIKTDGNKH